jgi:hypothetical protein
MIRLIAWGVVGVAAAVVAVVYGTLCIVLCREVAISARRFVRAWRDPLGGRPGVQVPVTVPPAPRPLHADVVRIVAEIDSLHYFRPEDWAA